MNLEKILDEKLAKLFPDSEMRSGVIDTLNQYGQENHEQEPSRVKLAILKLSGNDTENIKKYTNMAKQDYRDILSWAEYPRQSKKVFISDKAEKAELTRLDLEEYQRWLAE